MPLLEELLALGGNGQLLADDKGALTGNMIYKEFRKVLCSLGIDAEAREITIHSLRNTFISYMSGAGISPSKIKAIAGHKDRTDMTEWYTYWRPEMFDDVYKEQERLWQEITTH